MEIYLLSTFLGVLLGWWMRPQSRVSLPDVIMVLRITKQLERELRQKFPIRVSGLSAYTMVLPKDPDLRKAFLRLVTIRNRLVHTEKENLDPNQRKRLTADIRVLQRYGFLEGI